LATLFSSKDQRKEKASPITARRPVADHDAGVFFPVFLSPLSFKHVKEGVDGSIMEKLKFAMFGLVNGGFSLWREDRYG